jgi:hypothetical protein
MTARLDRFSLVTAPFSLYFNDTHLSDATGFIWQQGRRIFASQGRFSRNAPLKASDEHLFRW